MDYILKFVTKGLEIEDDNERIFSGHITAEVVDKQNEFIARDEVLKVIDTFMSIIPVLSEVHSNRMIGKVLSYTPSEIHGVPSVKIRGQVFKNDKVSLYDKVWAKVGKEYKGLSIGGASKKREPIIKQGKVVMNLSDLEMYEIALCEEPANPLAVIDYVNEFAKSEDMIQDVGGRKIIQCDSIMCQFDGIQKKDSNTDADTDSNDYISDLRDMVTKIYSFTKPVRGHSWEYWQDKLREDHPDYTDEQINATIGSWEAGS